MAVTMVVTTAAPRDDLLVDALVLKTVGSMVELMVC